ncbi:hypothetical protein DL93DRAFT_998891 [Clavulina sp. PMI_390]|nr:hypothetical protein DL93DRAFT_998891 [Clavulina sp. PMI_390]
MLPLNEMITFAARPSKISHPNLRPAKDLSERQPPSHTFTESDRFRFALGNQDAFTPAGFRCLLPGGRWFLGVDLSKNGHARLMCWDIANAIEGLASEPIASIDSRYSAARLPKACLRVQYNVDRTSVTCLLTYMGPLDEGHAEDIHMEIIRLHWLSELAPQFQFITETTLHIHRISMTFSSELDGDVVCSHHGNASFSLWNWRRSWYRAFDKLILLCRNGHTCFIALSSLTRRLSCNVFAQKQPWSEL